MKRGATLSAAGLFLLLGAGIFVSTRRHADAQPSGATPDSVRTLLRHKQYREAAQLAADLLDARTREQGPDSVAVAAAIEILIEARAQTGCMREEEANLELARRAVRIRERQSPSDPAGLRSALAAEAEVDRSGGDRESAIRLRRRVVELAQQEPAQGRDAALGTALYELGRDLVAGGYADEAGDVLRRAQELRERTDGARSPLVAEALEGRAHALPYGDPQARVLAQRAVDIQEGAAPEARTDLASALSTLGTMLNREGAWIEAARFHERALALYQDEFGADDPRVGHVLVNVALNLQDRGDNAGARRILERVLQVRQACLGADHPRLAPVLNNLGVAYTETGNFARARETLERALAIERAKLRPDHPWTARTLNDLAHVLFEEGDLAATRGALVECLAIREKLRARREISLTLSNLAEVLVRQGELPAARAALTRALTIQTELWGARSRDVALTLLGFGILESETGDQAAAASALTRAVRMLRETVGESAPQLSESLTRLAIAQARGGGPGVALETAIEAETLSRERFRNTTRVFSETEALEYASMRTSALDLLLALLTQNPGHLPGDAAERIFDQVVRSRALVLDEMASRPSAYLAPGPENLEALAQELTRARQTLAKVALVAPSGGDAVRSAARAAEELERELAEKSRAYRLRRSRFQAGLQEVRAALPHDAALVAYSRYTLPPGSSPPGRPAQAAYVAFVLRRDRARPRVVALGAAERVDELVRRWREQVASAPPPLPAAAREAERRCRDEGLALRRAIWDPVAAELDAPSMVFIVPDGALHHVSFATLPSSGERYFVEDGPPIHYLSAERDLVSRAGPRTRGRGLLVVGDPDFDAQPGPASVTEPSVARTPESTVSQLTRPERNPQSSCADLRHLTFTRLPMSGEETAEIAQLWTAQAGGTTGKGDVVVKTGASASEAELKSDAPGRRFLHIATHGFVAPESCGSTLHAPEVAFDAARRGAVLDVRESPLLHSGLALAGANQRGSVDPYSATEDGILTAQEIASIDLSAAEWVVLSGCETGVGEVRGGEGVLGLRRAFEIAGAGTLIMSLWEVREDATRSWMRSLYEARLGGLSTSDAVQAAHRHELEARRAERRSTHPYYWGPFIAVGDWR